MWSGISRVPALQHQPQSDDADPSQKNGFPQQVKACVGGPVRVSVVTGSVPVKGRNTQEADVVQPHNDPTGEAGQGPTTRSQAITSSRTVPISGSLKSFIHPCPLSLSST